MRQCFEARRVQGDLPNRVRANHGSVKSGWTRWTRGVRFLQATKEALMRIEIKARKVAVSDDLRKRVEKRFEKIAKQVSSLAELEVELSEDRNPRVANSQIAEVTLRLKGTTLRARESSANMLTAVNE